MILPGQILNWNLYWCPSSKLLRQEFSDMLDFFLSLYYTLDFRTDNACLHCVLPLLLYSPWSSEVRREVPEFT